MTVSDVSFSLSVSASVPFIRPPPPASRARLPSRPLPASSPFTCRRAAPRRAMNDAAPSVRGRADLAARARSAEASSSFSFRPAAGDVPPPPREEEEGSSAPVAAAPRRLRPRAKDGDAPLGVGGDSGVANV